MEFAKKQLEKYGWKEGQGLGKNEDGINVAIKPKLKFDSAGIGHDVAKEFTDDWWNSAYQQALNNIEVTNEPKGDVAMTLKCGESIDISNKSYLKELKRQNINLEYGSFLKTAKLTPNGTVDYETSNMLEPKKEPKLQTLTDDELFAACGGRTAHKGARHGLKLNGKLSRLEKQEKMLLKRLQNVSLCDDKNDIERKMKKISKHKEKHKTNIEDAFSILNFEDDSRSSSSSTSKKYKRKKKRKSVSFNNTVTEYITQDLDSSVHSSDSNEASVVLTIIEKSPIKDECPVINPNIDLNIFDEGIEQDIEAGGSEDCNHNSFEQAQSSKNDRLSKAERKLMKKKNRATMRFLQELNESINEDLSQSTSDECKKCMKRKQDEDFSGITMSSKRYCEFSGNVWERRKYKNKKKRNKEKARKHRKHVEKGINSIAKSLDKVCKISDSLQ